MKIFNINFFTIKISRMSNSLSKIAHRMRSEYLVSVIIKKPAQ
jgi:hypothetical protein